MGFCCGEIPGLFGYANAALAAVDEVDRISERRIDGERLSLRCSKAKEGWA
jgi:hypothetical protein